jgi:large subunit ribosomal protein L7/L12
METRRWNPEIVEIGDRIVGLSVAQAARLVIYLDAVHGVKAFDLPLQSCVPEPDLVVPPICDPEFGVLLTGFEAARKIVVIKTVREHTGLGLKEAKDFVEALPKVIKTELARPEAEKLKAQLEAAGATATIQAAT